MWGGRQRSRSRVDRASRRRWYGKYGRAFPGARAALQKRLVLANTFLADGYSVAFTQSRGDWKFQMETYHLHGYNQNRMCHKCAANKVDSDLLFTNFRSDAPWRNTVLTHTEFMNAHQTCPLVGIVGWHLTSIRTCSMHCLNLGVGKHVNGNILFLLCRDLVFGERPLAAQLRRAYENFLQWKSLWRMTCSQKMFTPALLSRKTRAEFPELKTKAHAGRVITAWLCETQLDHMRDDVDGRLRMTVVWSLDRLYDCLEMGDKLMSQDEADRFHDHTQNFLMSYHALACTALANGECLWAVKPKMHMMQHMGLEVKQERWNPRSYHGFQDEDMIGRTLRISRRSLVSNTTIRETTCVL